MLTTSSWQRQTEDASTPEGVGVSTEAVQFPGKYVETTTKDGRKMCQRKQRSSKASDNRFSMTSTSLSIDSVYEEERFPAKPGKDALGQYEKRSKDTWQSNTGYFAIYPWIHCKVSLDTFSG